tara:strand:- start:18361 stop:19449 length:1089 start_codon:yes stop_codon:yes gene_type:complete
LYFFSKLIFLIFFFNCFNNLSAFEIKDIRFGQKNEVNRIVLDISNDVKFKSLIYKKKLELIFFKDLKNISKKKYNTEYVEKIDFFSNEKKVTIIFKKEIQIKNLYSIKKNSIKDFRIVIDFSLKEKSINNEKNVREKIIIIDAGHGGKDSGAIGVRKILEKDVTLVVAKKLKKRLQKNKNYRVILTRQGDRYLRLRDRVKIARKNKADLFISLHADFHRNKNVSGVSIYTLSERASDKEAEALAKRENKSDLIEGLDLSLESKEVANILIDLTQRETMNQSSYFVDFLIKEFRIRTKLLQRTHRFAGFAVLKAPDIPSVLIEMGYLSNKKDAELLVKNNYHEKIIDSINNGIDNYFKWKMDK